MRLLFSVISLLIVIGIAVWWNMQSLSRDINLITPSQNGTGDSFVTPIDEARVAKQLIESKTAADITP